MRTPEEVMQRINDGADLELVFRNPNVNGQVTCDVALVDQERPHVGGLYGRRAVILSDPMDRHNFAIAAAACVGSTTLAAKWETKLAAKCEELLTASPGPVLVNMANVEALPVIWLWPPRVPLGCLTLFVGAPGGGKGHVTIDMAARITTGSAWPDGTGCEQGHVVLISAEDDLQRVVKPRLVAAHADCSKVTALTCVRRTGSDGKSREVQFTLDDVDTLEKTLDRVKGVRLVIIDPIGSYVSARTDSYRDNEVRAVLAPIHAMAERHECSIVCVVHRRKNAGGTADEGALGSRAFTGIARSVWHFAQDLKNRDRRFMLSGKNNLARQPDGLAFSLIGEPTAAVSWERDAVMVTADEQIAAEQEDEKSHRGPAAEAREQAEEWLRHLLASGPLPVTQIQQEARGAGMSFSGAVRRAREMMGIVPFREQFGGVWYWKLPQERHQAQPPSRSDEELLEQIL
jgi:putative DNA primase/helicase